MSCCQVVKRPSRFLHLSPLYYLHLIHTHMYKVLLDINYQTLYVFIIEAIYMKRVLEKTGFWNDWLQLQMGLPEYERTNIRYATSQPPPNSARYLISSSSTTTIYSVIYKHMHVNYLFLLYVRTCLSETTRWDNSISSAQPNVTRPFLNLYVRAFPFFFLHILINIFLIVLYLI